MTLVLFDVCRHLDSSTQVSPSPEWVTVTQTALVREMEKKYLASGKQAVNKQCVGSEERDEDRAERHSDGLGQLPLLL